MPLSNVPDYSPKKLPELGDRIRDRLRFRLIEIFRRIGVPGLMEIGPVGDSQDESAVRIGHLKAVVELLDLPELLQPSSPITSAQAASTSENQADAQK
jgi:hypothetical protein